MTIKIRTVLSSFSMIWVLSFLSIIQVGYCRSVPTGRSIKWYPDSEDFSSDPFHLTLSLGDIIEFVCKPEHPMSFYRVEREEYFSCKKSMHSNNVGSCGGSNDKIFRTLRSDPSPGGISWKPDTYYIIAVETNGKRQYCKENYLRMMLTVVGADQPKLRTTTEMIPQEAPAYRLNPNAIREIKPRSSRDHLPLPLSPERFNGGKVMTSQEIINGHLRFVSCIGSEGSENEKESTRKKGAACIMLNPSYYNNGKSTDLMDTRYLPLYGGSRMYSVVLPILVALFLL